MRKNSLEAVMNITDKNLCYHARKGRQIAARQLLFRVVHAFRNDYVHY